MTDRRPEIDAYLREHGDRYTPQALRSALLDAGYDRAEVDAALSGWQPNGPAATELRGRFWRYTWLAHGLALLIVVALVAVAGNSTMRGVWPIVAAILAVVLLVGVALSGLIGGRVLLPRAGLGWALVIPVASALLIGGSCYAMTGGFGIGAPPAPNGQATLHLELPEAIDASGPTHCRAPEAGSTYSIYADELQSARGPVSVSLDAHPGTPDLFLSLPSDGGDPASQFSVDPQSTVTIAAGSDRLHGSVDFEALAGMKETDVFSSIIATGRFAWDCNE